MYRKGDRIKVPESLKDVVLADISIADIENGWTEFSAVCDAVAAGRISAVLACERFGSASRGEKAYKAGHAYGLLLRTLHLCDTLTLEDFRREKLRALKHNERTHSLQRQIRRDGAGSRCVRSFLNVGFRWAEHSNASRFCSALAAARLGAHIHRPHRDPPGRVVH